MLSGLSTVSKHDLKEMFPGLSTFGKDNLETMFPGLSTFRKHSWRQYSFVYNNNYI